MRGNCVEVARATNPEFVALVVEERQPPVGQRLRYSLSDSERGMHCLYIFLYVLYRYFRWVSTFLVSHLTTSGIGDQLVGRSVISVKINQIGCPPAGVAQAHRALKEIEGPA